MILITIFILILQISFSESKIFSYGLQRGNISSIYSCRIAALSTLFAGFLSLNALHMEKLEKGVSIYCGLFQVSYSNLLIETLIYIIGSLVLLSSTYIITYLLVPRQEINDNLPLFLLPSTLSLMGRAGPDKRVFSCYLKSIKGSEPAKNYSLIALFSMLGSSLLLASCDLLSMYLSIELQSFSLYILATLYRNSGSTSAGLKYFLLGGLSSCIILLGSGLVYALTGLTGFDSLYSLISSMNIISLENNPLNLGENFPILAKLRPDYNDIMSLSYGNTSLQRTYSEIFKEMVTVSKDFQLGLSLGLILIFSGLLFKISAAPFHNWSPDVYDESPTYVTTWLTVMPKISILILLFEIYFHMALPTNLEGVISLPNIYSINWVFSGGELADLTDNLIVSGLSQPANFISSTVGANLELGKLGENNILIDYLERSNLLRPKTLADNAFFIPMGKEDTSHIDLLTTLKLNTDVLLKNILLFSSFLSLIIGTVLGLSQIKIKRLLAYSTISHVGFLLLCLAIKTEVSVESFIFYLIQYSITNLNAFLILLALGIYYMPMARGNILIAPRHKGTVPMAQGYLSEIISDYQPRMSISPQALLNLIISKNGSVYSVDSPSDTSPDRENPISEIVKKETNLTSNPPVSSPMGKENTISSNLTILPMTKENLIEAGSDGGESKYDVQFINELQEKFKHNSALSLSFALTLFSMAGIPPLIGFFGKQSVIYSAIDSGYYFMTVIAIIVSVISASYYLRLIKEANSSLEIIGLEKIISYKENVVNSSFHITEKSKTDDASLGGEKTPVSRKLLGSNDSTNRKEKAEDFTSNYPLCV